MAGLVKWHVLHGNVVGARLLGRWLCCGQCGCPMRGCELVERLGCEVKGRFVDGPGSLRVEIQRLLRFYRPLRRRRAPE